MRVLHVITKLELGGAQQNTLHTCRRLAEAGHEVVLATGPGGLLDDEARAAPHDLEVIEPLVRRVSPTRDAAALFALARLVRRLRPDVVHTHSSKAGALGRMAARAGRAGRRQVTVHTIHGWSFSDNHPPTARAIYRVVERACAPLTDHFVSVSGRDLETGRRLGLVGTEGSVIRSGVDVAAFSPKGPGREARRAEWGLDDRDVAVLSLSCLKPQKAPLDLVRVAARALEREPRLFFAVAGDGELRGEVEREVERLGIGARFRLLGWRRDVPELLRASDLVVLTSLWEGLPRSLVQARLCGVPVVATAVNGSPEAVEDGATGLLREAGDVDGLADALVELGSDDERRARFAEAARGSHDFRREFDQEEMVRRQVALYERLLSERSR